jgi:hypothetical protein
MLERGARETVAKALFASNESVYPHLREMAPEPWSPQHSLPKRRFPLFSPFAHILPASSTCLMTLRMALSDG